MLKLGGHLPHLGDGQVALTSTVMKGQKIKKGQRIVVRGARGRVELTVAAAYHDPSHLFADQALVSDATMDRLDPTAAAQVVLVRGGTERALSRAFADAPGLRVVDGAGYVKAASDAMTKGMSVIYGFILMALVLALFGMATTVSMSVGERTREFGLLGAVGATAAQIRSIVRWEAATVVLLGSLLGLGTALGTVTLLHIATGSSFLVPNAPWWLFATVITGAAAVTLAVSPSPPRTRCVHCVSCAAGPEAEPRRRADSALITARVRLGHGTGRRPSRQRPQGVRSRAKPVSSLRETDRAVSRQASRSDAGDRRVPSVGGPPGPTTEATQ